MVSFKGTLVAVLYSTRKLSNLETPVAFCYIKIKIQSHTCHHTSRYSIRWRTFIVTLQIVSTTVHCIMYRNQWWPHHQASPWHNKNCRSQHLSTKGIPSRATILQTSEFLIIYRFNICSNGTVTKSQTCYCDIKNSTILKAHSAIADSLTWGHAATIIQVKCHVSFIR